MKNNSGEMRYNSLEALEVIDRLEVGPVRIEPNRLRTTYRVIRSGTEESTELTYRYEEDVFDPDDRESLNLASMISVQAALNYGLFCKEMVFHDAFDKSDRRFIQGMARNTAREIYVKKILEHNPFLVNETENFPVFKLDNYCQANIRFSNKENSENRVSQKQGKDKLSLKMNKSGYAILSSGGKDSLLSFGLLNEIGFEIHPVFINESGRHWFTAMNAYGYFSANIPHTARVWTDSDRLFNWMLRHLPFIRRDFSNIRSDQYPIRLWTVAVFVFGALPIMRKRGAARLVIGDEYDTTLRQSYHGISHFDGLYDQSRYFDNSMTRYFHSKG